MFYASTSKFSFYFSLKINSFSCLCLGPLLDFIYNKSKLYYGFTQLLVSGFLHKRNDFIK